MASAVAIALVTLHDYVFKLRDGDGVTLLSRYNQLSNIINLLDRRRQVLKTIFGNEHVICNTLAYFQHPSLCQHTFDPHTTHTPVLVQHTLINVLLLFFVLEVRLNDELAEVDTRLHGNDAAFG